MNKIISIQKSIQIAKKIRNEGKTIVLAGGCFDIIHAGHIIFLNKAKKQGDVLFVLLESDNTVKRLKGNDRPVNNQKDRAIILSSLVFVDYVIVMPEIKADSKYDEIITKIHPSVIATTTNDPNITHKKRQAKLINAKVLYVTKRISGQSTSRIVNLTPEEIL